MAKYRFLTKHFLNDVAGGRLVEPGTELTLSGEWLPTGDVVPLDAAARYACRCVGEPVASPATGFTGHWPMRRPAIEWGTAGSTPEPTNAAEWAVFCHHQARLSGRTVEQTKEHWKCPK
jgi:hypothetical protein